MQEPQADALLRQPTVSPSLIRVLPIAVLAMLVIVAAISAITLLALKRADLWPSFGASCGVAVLSAGASMVIILRSAGKPAEFVITMIMLLALVRIAISLIGLIVCVKALSMPADPTAIMIGGHYAATLVVESILIRRALNGPPQGSNEIRGNQG